MNKYNLINLFSSKANCLMKFSEKYKFCLTIKSIILIISGCLSTIDTSAQSISMSMSIDWKEKNIYIFNYSKTKVPFLKICYTNNTKDSIFFYENKSKNKYIDFNFGEPYSPSYVVGQKVVDLTEEVDKCSKTYYDNNFRIQIGHIPDDTDLNFYLFKDKAKISYDSYDSLFDIAWNIDKLSDLLYLQDQLNTKDSTLQ